MKRHHFLAFFLLLITCCIGTSCKKKDKGSSFDNIRIATIDYQNGGAILHYHITYDQYSNVDSVVFVGDGTAAGHNGFKKFTYFGSSYSLIDENNVSFTVYANTAGQILKVLLPDTLIMHYNGAQLTALDTKTAKADYPYYTISTEYYTWKNGDVASISAAGGIATTYYYDLSKGGQAGDIFRVDNFINYGRSFVKTDHLPKGMLVGTDTVEKYYYQFEATGKISQMVRVNVSGGLDSTIYNYRYY